MGMKNIQMGRAPDCTHVAHLENILGVEALKVFFFHLTEPRDFVLQKKNSDLWGPTNSDSLLYGL